MSERRKEVPAWLVERLAAGELPESRAALVHDELLAAGDEARLTRLRDDNRATLEQHPAESVAAEIRRRLATQRARHDAARAGFRLTDLRVSLPIVASGAALIAIATSLPLERGLLGSDPALQGPDAVASDAKASNPTDEVRLKGLVPRLTIYKKTSDGASPLHDGSAVWPGDVIQVAYVAAGYRYGVVLSVDGNRAVTLHLPEAQGPAVPLNPQGETALGHAFELDATSGRERFVFVASKQPFTTDTIIDAMRAGATLPPAFVTTELSLHKSTP